MDRIPSGLSPEEYRARYMDRPLQEGDPLRTMDGDALDALVKSWGDGRLLSQHLSLTLAYMEDYGAPPPAGQPVPLCCCPTCATYEAGGGEEDARAAEQIVGCLARMRPEEREEAARTHFGGSATLPPPATLARLAGYVPGALRAGRPRSAHHRAKRDLRPALDIDAARAFPILEAAQLLGLGEPKRAGREHLVRCVLHEDRRASLRLNPGKGTWYCDPCGEGGDGIALVMRVRGLTFPDAVRFLTGG